MGRNKNELRSAAGLILKLRIVCSRTIWRLVFYLLILVPLHFWLLPPHFILLWRQHCLRPSAKGAFRGPCLPKWELCPPKRGLCLKERSRLGAIGVQFEAWGPPKILIITLEFVSKNRFFSQILRSRIFFFFMVVSHEFEGTKFFVPPKKKYLCLPSHATLAPDIQNF